MNAPEDFILRFAGCTVSRQRVPEVLDVACGSGRHALFFARKGCHVVAMERATEHLASLGKYLENEPLPLEPVRADVEKMSLLPESFDAIVNTFFLYRPLAEGYANALRPAGVLYFRTFTKDHHDVLGNARPRSDFLLGPGELGRLYPGLDFIHYEESISEDGALATLVASKKRP